MNKLKYILLFLFFVLGAGGYTIKNYLSSQGAQDTIRQEFVEKLTQYGIPQAEVKLGTIHWAGVWHPFSVQIDTVNIRDQDREVRVKTLILGVDAIRLLLGAIHLKHMAVRNLEVLVKGRSILTSEFEVKMDDPALSLKINRIEVNPKDLTDVDSYFSHFKGLDFPLSLSVSIDYNGREVRLGAVRATIESGSIHYPPFYPNKTPVQEAKFEINLTPNKLKLTQCKIRIGDANAQLTGAITSPSILQDLKSGKTVSISVQGELDRLPVDLIDTYWPHGLAADARDWVTTNLSKGEASDATLFMKGKLRVGDAPDFEITELSGDIKAQGVDVAYLGNLPKVTNTSGHCRYTKSNFIIDAHGTCDGMAVKDAHLDMSQLDQEHGHMDLDLKVEGGVQPALDLISQKPLMLTQKLGLDPKLFKGDAQTHLILSFPLEDDTPLDAVKVTASSTIKKASLIHPKFNEIMSEGDFDLSVTNGLLTLAGTGIVAGHPSEINAHKNFDTNDRSLTINGKDTKKDIKLGNFYLGLKNGRLSGRLDLSKIAYDIPMAIFMKETGEAGSLEMTGTYDNDVLILKDWNLKFGTATAKGNGIFKATGEQQIKVTQATVGELTGHGDVILKDKSVQVAGRLAVVDLDHIYHHYQPDESPSDWSVSANMDIDKLLLSNKMNFGPVKAHITQAKGDLTSLKIESKDPGKLEVFVAPEKDGAKNITLTCHKAGDVLDYFVPNSDFEGGQLNLVGHLSGQPGHRLFKAELDLRDFVAVKAPVLAQILSVSSLDGIFRTLSGQGISFSNTTGHVEWGNDRVTLKDIHASGPSIALNLDGHINLITDNIAMEGELYPINSLNTAMSYVPLVGTILGGGKNRGIFSTSFSLTGKYQDPKITANPLSTIAPQGMKEIYKNQG